MLTDMKGAASYKTSCNTQRATQLFICLVTHAHLTINDSEKLVTMVVWGWGVPFSEGRPSSVAYRYTLTMYRKVL